MLLLGHVHVRPGFGMIDTIGRIVEKRIDWNQSFNYRSDPFCDKVITFRAKSNLEGFVWSHPSITGLVSQRQFAPGSASFWQVGHLDVFLSEYPDESHNLTNLIFMTSSL